MVLNEITYLQDILTEEFQILKQIDVNEIRS